MAIASPSFLVETATPPIEPDGLYEEIDGQVVEKPEMAASEAWVAAILVRALNRFDPVDSRGRVVQEMLFLIDPDSGLKRRPDVAFIAYDRWPQGKAIPSRGPCPVVPSLAVEVVSPTNFHLDDVRKLHEYFEAGVDLVWLVYPNVREVYAYESPQQVRILKVGDHLDGGQLLPEFRFPVADLFVDIEMAE